MGWHRGRDVQCVPPSDVLSGAPIAAGERAAYCYVRPATHTLQHTERTPAFAVLLRLLCFALTTL